MFLFTFLEVLATDRTCFIPERRWWGALCISFLIAYFIYPQAAFDGFTLMENMAVALPLHEMV